MIDDIPEKEMQIPEKEKEEWSRIAELWKSSFKDGKTYLRLLELILIIGFGFIAGQGLDTRHVVERCNLFIAKTYIENTGFEQCVSLVKGDRYAEINKPGMFLNFSHAIQRGDSVKLDVGEPSKNISYQWKP